MVGEVRERDCAYDEERVKRMHCVVTPITDGDLRDRTVVASGTSCLDQLDDLLDRPTRHPIQLLSPW